MLNKELMDSRDKQIHSLQAAIREFKKYDGERKKYLQKIQTELEDYSEKYCMLKESLSEGEKEMLKKYEDKILAQKVHIKALQKQLSAYKNLVISKGIDEETLQRLEHLVEHYSKIKLAEENEQLKKDMEKYRRDSHDNIAKIVALQKQLADKNKQQCGNS